MIITIVMLFFIKPCWSVELRSCNSTVENQLCKLQEFYDKTKVPGRIPITLTPTIFDILEVSEVNVIERSVTVYLRLVVQWKDDNLSFSNPNTTEYNYIPFDKETSQLIWRPKLSFLNIKSAEKLAGFGYKELNEFYIFEEGYPNLQMNELIKITVYCNFNYEYFPFDNQECDLSMYDPINDATYVILNEIYSLCYKGMCKTFEEDEWLSLPQQHGLPYTFRLKNMGSNNSSLGNDDNYYNFPWSISTIRVFLHRNSLGLLIGSFYLPTGMFGFLSIGSYIINPDMNCRLGLLITLYLITFNVYGSISENLAPPERDFSYIEVWMAGVVITISVAILELFFILAIKRKNKFSNQSEMAQRIDFISLIITLVFYSCFVVIYSIKGFQYLYA